MKTDELISWLRLYADLHREGSVVRVNVNEAADRLEELDERVAIMSVNKIGKWQKEFFGVDNGVFWYRCPRCRKLRDYPEKYCPNCGMKMEGAEHDTRQRTPDLSDLRREDI